MFEYACHPYRMSTKCVLWHYVTVLALRAVLRVNIGCHLPMSLLFPLHFSLLLNASEVDVGNRHMSRSDFVSTAVQHSQPFCLVITLKGLRDTG
jgi:hypothetical protein